MKWILVLLFLSGCAGYAGSGLVPGETTSVEADKVMGPAAEKRPGAGGESVHYYSRQPYGREIYAARFSRDGRLIAIEQRLTTDNIGKLVPGTWNADQVRDLLGPPFEVHQLSRQQREVWTYWMDGTTFPKHLYVQFSADRILRDVIYIDDPTIQDRKQD
jgi:hypothetical protein